MMILTLRFVIVWLGLCAAESCQCGSGGGKGEKAESVSAYFNAADEQTGVSHATPHISMDLTTGQCNYYYHLILRYLSLDMKLICLWFKKVK